MRKQQKDEHYLIWLIIAYVVTRLVFSGHFSVELKPGESPLPLSHAIFCGPLLAMVLTASPKESLGDGPGSK